MVGRIGKTGIALCAVALIGLSGCASANGPENGPNPGNPMVQSSPSVAVYTPSTSATLSGMRARVARLGEACSKQGAGSCNKIGGYLVPEAAQVCKQLAKVVPEVHIDPAAYAVTRVVRGNPEIWQLNCFSAGIGSVTATYARYDLAGWRKGAALDALKPVFSRSGADQVMVEGDPGANNVTAERLTPSGLMVAVLLPRNEKASLGPQQKKVIDISKRARVFFEA